MSHAEFCYWLKRVFELMGNDPMPNHNVKVIKRMLDRVIKSNAPISFEETNKIDNLLKSQIGANNG